MVISLYKTTCSVSLIVYLVRHKCCVSSLLPALIEALQLGLFCYLPKFLHHSDRSTLFFFFFFFYSYFITFIYCIHLTSVIFLPFSFFFFYFFLIFLPYYDWVWQCDGRGNQLTSPELPWKRSTYEYQTDTVNPRALHRITHKLRPHRSKSTNYNRWSAF